MIAHNNICSWIYNFFLSGPPSPRYTVKNAVFQGCENEDVWTTSRWKSVPGAKSGKEKGSNSHICHAYSHMYAYFEW